MTFSPESLRRSLEGLPRNNGYLVAYSGGGDSTALLHAMHEIRESISVPVRAVHVVHNLHPDSPSWAEHCKRVCAAIGVELNHFDVRIDPADPAGPEGAARRARLDCFLRALEQGEILLTAHTRDDQAETVMLRLLRGTGLDGLAGIPGLRDFGAGWMARPMLEFSRSGLRAWLRARGYRWLEDPDNSNIGRSRVFLRHEVMPRLRRHWPAADTVMARAAENLAEAGEALSRFCAVELARVMTPTGEGIELASVRSASPAVRRQLLRHWIRQRGLPEPTRAQLDEIESQALQAAPDATALVAWPGAEVHRYRGRLYAFVPRAALQQGIELPWSAGDGPLDLPAGLGQLRLSTESGRLPAWRLNVRFRRGGERIRLPGREHHAELKTLFQEWGVPPWDRDRIPLVYEAGELAAIADLQPSGTFRERLERHGANLVWERGAAAAESGP